MAAEDLPAGAEVFCGWAPAASIFEAFHKRVCACCLAWGRGRAGPRIYCSAEVELAHFSRSQSPSLRQTQVLWVTSPPPTQHRNRNGGVRRCGRVWSSRIWLYIFVFAGGLVYIVFAGDQPKYSFTFSANPCNSGFNTFGGVPSFFFVQILSKCTRTLELHARFPLKLVS